MSTAQPVTGIPYQYSFSFKQFINAPYISFQLKTKLFSAKAGFRFEQTHNTFTNVPGSSFGNLVPSVLLQKSISSFNNFTLSYKQRVQRPNVNFLSPVLDIADPRYKTIGNPNLVAVINHIFELGFSSFKKGFVNATLGYSFSNNGVQNVFTTAPDSSIVSTYANIGKKNTISLNTSINYPLNKTLSFTLNGTLIYNILEGNVGLLSYRQKGVQGFIYSYLSQRLKNSWRTSVNFGFSGAPILLQGTTSGFFYNNFSLSKDLLNSKLSLNFSVANPFRKFRVIDTRFLNSTFLYSKYNENYFRNFNLSVFYSFGKLKSQVRRTRKSISNDDKLSL